MAEYRLPKISNDTFIKLIKGELTNDDAYKKFYQVVDNNGISEKSINLREVSLDSIILIENIKYEYSINIINAETNSIIIKSGSFNSISLHGITLGENAQFDIKGGTFEKFYIKGTINGHAYINGGNFGSLYFGDTNFTKTLSIIAGHFKEIYISGMKVSGLFIRGGKFDYFRIAGGAGTNDCIISGLYFSGGNITHLAIYGLSNIEKVYVTSGEIDNITLSSEGLKEIQIDGSKREYTEGEISKTSDPLIIKNIFIGQLNKIIISISLIQILSIKFTNSFINKDSIIRLNNVKSNELSFNDTINYGQLTFNALEITSNGLFNAIQSDLGKINFINCKISNSSFTIKSSRITEIFLSGTNMPEIIKSNSQEERRLGFSQIKKIHENRGDNIGYGRFFAHEMNAYYDTLSIINDTYEKINLAFNKYSNNHGQSWKQGLLSLTVASLTLYTIYCFILGFRLNFSPDGVNGFVNTCSYFLEFINPVHKTDYVADNLSKNYYIQNTSCARIWEGVSRIFLAYFIYQFIQAFRKHGKR